MVLIFIFKTPADDRADKLRHSANYCAALGRFGYHAS
jgi:hypothetical protein